jgi:YggT family protein
VLFYTLAEIVDYLISIIITLVIVQFIMSLLISFNVVNMHNRLVEGLWRAINAILDPMLNPIRRFMPHTGMLDLSPLVLIVLLKILDIVFTNLAIGSLS